MYYVSISEYISNVIDRIVCAYGLSSVLLRVHLLAMIFVLFVLIQDFQVSRLLLILAYLMVYYALLIYFDLNNQALFFYLIGFMGALFAVYMALQWQAAIPSESTDLVSEYCRQRPQAESCLNRLSTPSHSNQ